MAKNALVLTKKSMRTSGFSLVSEDVVENILSRLPALSFASAACVNKTWNRVCGRLLSRPKLASALSLNPSLHDAVKEVLDRVLLEPIVPHFVIACIGKQLSLELTHQLLVDRFGSRVPIITNAANGLIGLDVATNGLKEVRWDLSDDEDQPGSRASNPLDREKGIVLTVGFVPGLKVEAIPLLHSITVPQKIFVDKFIMDIKNFTSSVSDSTSPAGIILFGGRNIDIKPVLARIDLALNEQTVIVGDASGCFLCTSVDQSHNNYENMYLFDAVALVFAKDKHKSQGIGETQFHVTLSTGVMPFGPQLQAVCIMAKDSHFSWLTARMQGHYDILDGEDLLADINEQFTEENCPEIYIGVIQHREYPIGEKGTISRASLMFYEVIGGDQQFFVINGVGIRPGDHFLFYHSDSDTASSSCNDAFKNLETLKSKSKNKSSNNLGTEAIGCNGTKNEETGQVFGGFIFSCYLRGETFRPNVDSSPIHKNFPDIPLAGMYCVGEIGRGNSSSISQEDDEENSARCCLHYRSSVYLVLSYIPPASSED